MTPNGQVATAEESTAHARLKARFELAVTNVKPFSLLYGRFKGSKLPAHDILADTLTDVDIPKDFREECVDTFVVNCKFLNLLRAIAGSERLIALEQALDTLPAAPPTASEDGNVERRSSTASSPAETNDAAVKSSSENADVCFYVTPIGADSSEVRSHADFMMEFVIRPALKELDLKLVRADQIGQPGMIGKQIVEHILKSRLVIADLSFHNPNVFYELCLRHVTRLPTVQIKRAADGLPFDLNQSRTISIETTDVYKLYLKLQIYVSEIASQIRGALQDFEAVDNPISLYYPKARLVWE